MNRSKRIPGRLVDIVALALGLAVFCSLAFHRIHLPGLHTDEALEVIPAVQLVRGQEVECFKDVCVDLFGLRLPVMIYEYIATVNTYMVIPFLATLGVNVPALRTMPIVQSMVAMVFLYLLARELYNRRVAVLTLFLIAVNPSFIFWSRQGVFVTSVTIPISLAAVWAWLRWWRSGRTRYFYLGTFLFGLGISAKILFGWLIAGVAGAFVLLNLDRIVNCVRTRSLTPLHSRLSWREVMVGGALLILGLTPLIIFNVQTQSTINYVRANVSAASYYDVDNTQIAVNLRERIKQLRSVLNGETFWYLAVHPLASWRYPSVFLIAIGALAFAAFGSRRQTLGETLPIWITVAAAVVPCYVALFFLHVHEPHWYRWFPIIALLSTVLTGVFLGRGRGPRFWGRQLLVGMSACALFMLYVYLAWKLAQWFMDWKIYPISVLALILAPGLRGREDARKVCFPVLVIAVMLLASVKTPTALWFTHLAILTPWPILAIAAIADLVVRRSGLDKFHLARWRALSDRRWATTFSLGLVAVLALTGMLIYDDLGVDKEYYRGLDRVGGKGDHTAASYKLVAYLQEQQISDVVAMDWGIQDVVQFLSAGEINPPEIFGHQSWDDVDPAFAIRVRERLGDPDVVYVFHERPHFKNRREAFEAVVTEEGKTAVEEMVIYDRSANPIYRLVRVTS
jgi:hypothetical protein